MPKIIFKKVTPSSILTYKVLGILIRDNMMTVIMFLLYVDVFTDGRGDVLKTLPQSIISDT